MNKQTYGQMDIRASGHTGKWTYGQVDIRASGHTGKWTYGQMNIRTSGHTDKWTYGQMNIRTSGHTGKWAYEQSGNGRSLRLGGLVGCGRRFFAALRMTLGGAQNDVGGAQNDHCAGEWSEREQKGVVSRNGTSPSQSSPVKGEEVMQVSVCGGTMVWEGGLGCFVGGRWMRARGV